MSHFTNSLHTEWLSGGSEWRVTETFEFHWGEPGSGFFIRCLNGMITDLASIPRLLRWLVPKLGKDSQASCVHDQGYQDGFILVRAADGTETRRYVERIVVDEMYLQAMIALDVGKLRRWAIYYGVRLGGWFVWAKYRKAEQ